MRGNFRGRLERLERGVADTGGVINWDNLHRGPDDLIPDGVIDWLTLFSQEARDAPCPIEARLAEIEALPAPVPINNELAPTPVEDE